jgi:Ca2+-transporting ATPase
MLVGPLAGLPTPLTPLQILWMNLITDGPPALALGVEPAERDVMQRPPSKPGEGVFSRGVGRDVLWIGLLMGAIALAVGWIYWAKGLPQWQTMLFTTLTLSQMALALAVRSDRESFFRQGAASNPALAVAVAGSTLLQLCVLYVEPVRRVFGIVALAPLDLAIAAAGGGSVFLAVEAKKAIARAMNGKRRG